MLERRFCGKSASMPVHPLSYNICMADDCLYEYHFFSVCNGNSLVVSEAAGGKPQNRHVGCTGGSDGGGILGAADDDYSHHCGNPVFFELHLAGRKRALQ